MRREQLKMLKGGGEPAPCELCARGLYLGEGDDRAAMAGILDVIADRTHGQIRVCTSHREDLEGMGYSFSGGLHAVSRRERRASMAAMRRVHRASLPRPLKQEPEPTPSGEGGSGGITF